MAEKQTIMFKILHKLNPLTPIRDPEGCDIKPIFFYQRFSDVLQQ